MIAVIKELISYDKTSLNNWLAKETFSKVLVFLVFILISLGISVSLYLFSLEFFKYLVSFELFGQATSVYIVKASILVVLWLGILSSIISTISFLLTPDRKYDYFFTLPVDLNGIIIYQNIKTLLLNLSLFSVLILPLLLSYMRSIGVSLPVSLTRGLIVLLIAATLSESLGSAIGYIVSNRFKKREGYLFIIFVSLLIVTLTISLFNTILPEQLRVLYASNPGDFLSIFQQLPLNKYCLINNNIASLVTNGVFHSNPAIFIVILGSIIVALNTQITLFKNTWQQVRVILPRLPLFVRNPRTLKYPSLLQKDILAVLRNPRELGYGLFLFALLIAFAGLFTRGIEVNRIPERFSSSMIIFSWLWLSFYSITYFMRICFPSMSKEGKTRWWLFTQPIRPLQILDSKIFTGIVFSIPIFLITIAEWWLIPFKNPSILLSIISFLAITTLMLAITMMGIIKPDYSQSEDPGKVSTGSSGLFALTASLGISGITGVVIYLLITQASEVSISIQALTLFFIVLTTVLYLLSYGSIKNHTTEIQ